MTSILIIHGPNLNLLGTREIGIYGKLTLDDINKACQNKAKNLKITCECFQSNSESELIDKIQDSKKFDGIIINAGAYTHTSVAIRDALLASGLPVVEVHLSNIFRREKFRHKSYISDIAHGVICGLGGNGYIFALDALTVLCKGRRKLN